ncbi:peptide/nickel transport system ATP-binding protein/oligopeptide transport system ATP-binding protein [Defluviimonas denitrificans]|jgi:peptide/nickel transport system ATP-binding protein/oligopeptide transport system ATP-binding protein|uniref:Peptide/nickel transport system ATP-binding protein/oligopeptide transport system ATP-binding protein n=1 Tax=Albidovulum denitrificans TaxID=404881 RepID=A0A2S8S8D8_9RHOB|nr:ABC transporter ATP-binding protein [Defluviimonas denitrificans]MCB1408822.1 ABC transporter ATP-binding protein [Paracoccaceae bacterium]PQV57085.1 peptide/nickel transport system ATP-binding protein/oligopeptide transport system ATP-binding protein [Defluviimonas denitrificans]
MAETDIILSVQGLTTEFSGDRGDVRVLDDVSFDVGRGRIVGVVGESGSGKSMTALSLMGLVPQPQGRVSARSITLDGQEISRLGPSAMRRIRGRDIAMVFQEPMTSLNPVRRVWEQVGEPLAIHHGLGRRAIRARVLEMFELVGIPEPKTRLDAYPHQLSGGLRQRAMIAMGLICEPKLLIADEPTTALDVTTQSQILRLMRDLRDRVGTSIILITHDLGIIAEMCDEVNVMYAGQLVEQGEVFALFDQPAHPYTRGLLASIPRATEPRAGRRMPSIPGMVPNLAKLPPGCRFNPRCGEVMPVCLRRDPGLTAAGTGSGPGHTARCWLHSPNGGTA